MIYDIRWYHMAGVSFFFVFLFVCFFMYYIHVKLERRTQVVWRLRLLQKIIFPPNKKIYCYMHASTMYVCSIYVAFINKFPHTHFFAFLFLFFRYLNFYLSIHHFKHQIKHCRLLKGRVLWLVFRVFALYNLLIGLWFTEQSLAVQIIFLACLMCEAVVFIPYYIIT